jgi:hypothetical protein
MEDEELGIKSMLAGLYDLIVYHGTIDDLTKEQCETITKLYNEVRPHKIIRERLAKVGK